MSVFAIISTAEPATQLSDEVRRVYPEEHYAVSPTVWLVADPNVTTQGVCKKLGIGEGGFQHALVVRVEHYWGRETKALWEWLSVKGALP